MLSELLARIREDLSQVDPLTLPSVSMENRLALPTTAGLYFLIHARLNLLYIGKASSLRTRWGTHQYLKHSKKLGHVQIYYLETPNPEIFETFLIGYHTPYWNQTDNPGYDPYHPYCDMRRYPKWLKTQHDLMAALDSYRAYKEKLRALRKIPEGPATSKPAAKLTRVITPSKELPVGLGTTKQAAELSGRAPVTIRRWAKEGRIQKDLTTNLYILDSVRECMKTIHPGTPPKEIPEGLVSCSQAAKIAGVKRHTISSWLKGGKIQKDPTTNLYILDSVRAYLASDCDSGGNSLDNSD